MSFQTARINRCSIFHAIFSVWKKSGKLESLVVSNHFIDLIFYISLSCFCKYLQFHHRLLYFEHSTFSHFYRSVISCTQYLIVIYLNGSLLQLPALVIWHRLELIILYRLNVTSYLTRLSKYIEMSVKSYWKFSSITNFFNPCILVYFKFVSREQKSISIIKLLYTHTPHTQFSRPIQHLHSFQCYFSLTFAKQHCKRETNFKVFQQLWRKL